MATYEHGPAVGGGGRYHPVRCERCSTSLGLVATEGRLRGMTAAEVLLYWPHLFVEVHAHQICCPARTTPREPEDIGAVSPAPVAAARLGGLFGWRRRAG